MSRSKAETETASETEKKETEEKSVVEEKVETENKIEKPKKYGVEFYLQQKTVSYEVSMLLKRTHKMSVMTIAEWDETLDSILAKKVIS